MSDDDAHRSDYSPRFTPSMTYIHFIFTIALCGDNDTRTDEKRPALLDAKRLALEQAGTYSSRQKEPGDLGTKGGCPQETHDLIFG